LSLKHQILELDKVLDLCLKEMNIKWKILWERMKNYNSFSNINNIWNAHKVRNKIAHELNFNINDINAKKSIKSFEIEIKIMLR